MEQTYTIEQLKMEEKKLPVKTQQGNIGACTRKPKSSVYKEAKLHGH